MSYQNRTNNKKTRLKKTKFQLYNFATMPQICSVRGCSKTRGFGFPTDPGLRAKWLAAINWTPKKRTGPYEPNKFGKVCEAHFRSEDLLEPVSQVGAKVRRFLRPGAVPSLRLGSSDIVSSEVVPMVGEEVVVGSSNEVVQKHEPSSTTSDQTKTKLEIDFLEVLPVRKSYARINESLALERKKAREEASANEEAICLEPCGGELEITTTPTSDVDVSSAPEGTSHPPKSTSQLSASQCSQTQAPLPFCSLEMLRDKPVNIKYYTGFQDYDHFMYFFHCLGPATNYLNYKSQSLSVHDELFLCLMKMRCAKDDDEIALFYSLSKSTVGRIFR